MLFPCLVQKFQFNKNQLEALNGYDIEVIILDNIRWLTGGNQHLLQMFDRFFPLPQHSSYPSPCCHFLCRRNLIVYKCSILDGIQKSLLAFWIIKSGQANCTSLTMENIRRVRNLCISAIVSTWGYAKYFSVAKKSLNCIQVLKGTFERFLA